MNEDRGADGNSVDDGAKRWHPDGPFEGADETPQVTDKSLVLDEFGEKLEAFQAFRKSDSKAAESILDTLGAQDDVDRDILLELSSPRPLGHPDRFEAAHSLMVRALEVLDRNGARGVHGWLIG